LLPPKDTKKKTGFKRKVKVKGYLRTKNAFLGGKQGGKGGKVRGLLNGKVKKNDKILQPYIKMSPTERRFEGHDKERDYAKHAAIKKELLNKKEDRLENDNRKGGGKKKNGTTQGEMVKLRSRARRHLGEATERRTPMKQTLHRQANHLKDTLGEGLWTPQEKKKLRNRREKKKVASGNNRTYRRHGGTCFGPYRAHSTLKTDQAERPTHLKLKSKRYEGEKEASEEKNIRGNHPQPSGQRRWEWAQFLKTFGGGVEGSTRMGVGQGLGERPNRVPYEVTKKKPERKSRWEYSPNEGSEKKGCRRKKESQGSRQIASRHD